MKPISIFANARLEVLTCLCCLALAGDRVVERALREKCCLIVVSYFLPDIAMLIDFTHIHRLELKTSARSELEETGLGHTADR